MKFKTILAAAGAAIALGAALPAAAHENDGRGQDRGGRHEERGDYRRGGDWERYADIVVRTRGRTLNIDRGDRLFARLAEAPYNFRPGRTYVYTDDCDRRGCMVIEYNPRHRQPQRRFAPHLPRNGGWEREHDRRDRDNDRRDDRRWD